MKQNLKELTRFYGYPLLALAKRDLKGEFGNSILGVYWIFLNPILLLALYTVVFSGILEIEFRRGGGIANFSMFLFAGILPYIALSSGSLAACNALESNKNLLTKAVFPAEVVPIVPVIRSAIPEIFGIVLLVLVVLIFTPGSIQGFYLLPLVTVSRLLLSAGIAWVVAIFGVVVKDTRYVLQVFFNFLLFLTPIFYPSEKYPDFLNFLLYINPLYYIIDGYRNIIMDGGAPLTGISISLLIGFFFAVAGFLFFKRTISKAKDFL